MTWGLWLVVVVCVLECSAMSQDELEDFSNFLLKTSQLDLHVKKGADPDDAFDEDELVSDHAWEESGKFEGDLILNDRQRRLIVETVEGLSRNGLTDSTKRWPNNEVIYFIQKEHFSSGQVQAIQDGIDDLARASCVKFRPYRKGDRDAVVIQGSRRGCFSQVGYQGGYQVLNLSGRHPVGRGCFRHGTVVHELLHTLGFYHMQSSPDRDDYIDVMWSNIVQPARHNFRKYNSFAVSDFGVGYDYDSVLHYSRKAFSANGQDTLVPKQRGAEIGQRVGLSDKDSQKLNKMYCDADNDHIQADENSASKPKNKKKKPKNQPFQGHGIGYHQGKTLVITVPMAQTYKLPNVASTPVFDFSKSPQVVSTPEAEGYQFNKEVTYSYKPIISLNTETSPEYKITKEYDYKPNDSMNVQNQNTAIDDKAHSTEENKDGHLLSPHSDGLNKVKPEYIPIDDHDKDLQDAFNRLTKIVKQHVYPQNHDNDPKVNKDYSKFYTPLKTEKPHNFQDKLGKKFATPILYGPPTTTYQKQIDQERIKIELDENDKQLTNTELDDGLDSFFRTALPIKKPYSSNEQTETPQYKTLKYLKGRNDFSSIYSPKTLEDDNRKITHSVFREEITPTEGDALKDINSKPHGYVVEFYTDYLATDSKDRLKDDTQEDITKEGRPKTYKLNKNSINKQSNPNLHLEDRMDAAYRTLFAIKKPYSAYERTETPKYATLEYLKDRHDFSNFYSPKTLDDDKRNQPYTILRQKPPPTEEDWYKKDSYKQNPAKYDHDSYTDYVKQDKNVFFMTENNRRLIDSPNNNHDGNVTESPKIMKPKYKTANYDQEFYTDYHKSSDEHLVDDEKRREFKRKPINNNEKNNRDYYTDHEKDLIDSLEDASFDNIDDENHKEPSKKSRLKHGSIKDEDDYYNDYEKGGSGYLNKDSDENIDKISKETKKNDQMYELYGAPVPLTDNWFKPSYSIPNIPHNNKNAKPSSHEDNNR